MFSLEWSQFLWSSLCLCFPVPLLRSCLPVFLCAYCSYPRLFLCTYCSPLHMLPFCSSFSLCLLFLCTYCFAFPLCPLSLCSSALTVPLDLFLYSSLPTDCSPFLCTFCSSIPLFLIAYCTCTSVPFTYCFSGPLYLPTVPLHYCSSV